MMDNSQISWNNSALSTSFKEQKESYEIKKKCFTKNILKSLEMTHEVHSGWLKARTSFKQWTRVWCQVKPGYLILYTSQESLKKHRLGVVMLSICQAIPRPTRKEGYCFKLLNPFDYPVLANSSTKAITFSHSSLTLRAPDKSIAKVWLDSLQICNLSANLDVQSSRIFHEWFDTTHLINKLNHAKINDESDDGYCSAKKLNMSQIFRQFFDNESSTYTYFLGDLANKVAVFIDTVSNQVERELVTIEEFKFDRIYLLSTHIHADHITGNGLLKTKLGSKAQSILSKYYENAKADRFVGENDELSVGCFKLNFLHTPGHTAGCLSIVDHENERVFTGDTLLIRGCGRTDLQGGNSECLYESVHQKLFKLPSQYSVYPAHDYKGRTVSSIAEEITYNPRLSKTKKEFVEIMDNLNLAYPKMIDKAVPANLNCGFSSETVN